MPPPSRIRPLMDARGIEERVAALREDARAAITHLAVAVALALSGVAVAFLLPAAAAVALGVAAVVELMVAAARHWRRRAAIESLALDAGAYHVPEVRLYGREWTTRQQRLRLADRLTGLPRLAIQGHTAYLRDRVADHGAELRALAEDLRDADVEIDPVAAVECVRLLEDAVASPLCNPKLDRRDLASVLYRIRAGMRRPR